MSRSNGEKSRAHIQRRGRIAQRVKDRAARAAASGGSAPATPASPASPARKSPGRPRR